MQTREYKALFLDRDGVVNEDSGYPYKPEHIQFIDSIFPLCRAALAKGYLLIILTNQAGVAKGKFSENDVLSLHEWMTKEFAKRAIAISRFYYCPHHPEAVIPEYRKSCNCRKPKPGMVEQAIADFDLDITRSLLIGDKPSDRITMDGLRSIIIKSQYTGDDFDVDELSRVAELL